MRDTLWRLQQEGKMILVLDLGNTNLCVGVYQNQALICSFRTDSDLNRSADMYATLLNDFLTKNHLTPSSFEGAILSSVIPSLTDVITRAVESIIGKQCLTINRGIKTGLSIHIDNPYELGADLIADSVGAKKKYGYPCIITDLGTADKLLVIDKDGNYIGGTISPGIKTAGKALTKNAAQLMDISYKAPKNVIGKNSPDALNSGAIYGSVSMINGLTKMIETELGYQTKHILTGGNSILVKNFLPDYTYDPNLIFEGLYQIYLRNK